MSLEHNNIFDNEFYKISDLRFYPYVGKNFDSLERRVMVYAHNIPVNAEIYNQEVRRISSKTHFADALSEFTYNRGKWTRTFRNFLIGYIGLEKDYSKNSDPDVLHKIEEFVKSISYTNFINGLIKSNNQSNIHIDVNKIKESKKVQNEVLRILNITHCIAWGSQVFDHLKDLPDFTVEETRNIKKRGFGYMKLRNEINQKTIHVLKIHHPSFPNYGMYKQNTHEIFQWFRNL